MDGFDIAVINETVFILNNSDNNPGYGISETMGSDPPDSVELLRVILLGCLGAAVAIILLFSVSYYFIWKHKKKPHSVEEHMSYSSIPSNDATAAKTAIDLNNYKDERLKSLDEQKGDSRTNVSESADGVKIDLETKQSKPTHPNKRGVFPRIALSPPKTMSHKETNGKLTPKSDNSDQVVYQNEHYIRNETETRTDSEAYEDDGYIYPLQETDICMGDYYTVAKTDQESMSDSKCYDDDGYVPPLHENGSFRCDYLTILSSRDIASEDIYANEGDEDYENVPDSCRK
ncbi:unnamed protein product [Owenia fusiformis]|uniref:Uncharacterized protein n=1 Tax=Owenia fusiformis TaxID=6347 RepID=A0A8J1TAW7_OWEFU|nr:unnamed protein product [Owenia fusiformis]